MSSIPEEAEPQERCGSLRRVNNPRGECRADLGLKPLNPGCARRTTFRASMVEGRDGPTAESAEVGKPKGLRKAKTQ